MHSWRVLLQPHVIDCLSSVGLCAQSDIERLQIGMLEHHLTLSEALFEAMERRQRGCLVQVQRRIKV